jgi:hypothetical protein
MACYATWWVGTLAVLSLLTTNAAAAQLMSTCVPNSPERRGETGCSIIESKLLPASLKEPVFWHIDRFDSAEAARAAAGPASIAFDAAGTWWLMTVESEAGDHRGGRHVTQVGPLPLPRVTKLAMMVQSAVFTPGMYSLVHHHSGVEAVYVIEGEACYVTDSRLHPSQRRDGSHSRRHSDAGGSSGIDPSSCPGDHRPRRGATSHDADGGGEGATARPVQVGRRVGVSVPVPEEQPVLGCVGQRRGVVVVSRGFALILRWALAASVIDWWRLGGLTQFLPIPFPGAVQLVE